MSNEKMEVEMLNARRIVWDSGASKKVNEAEAQGRTHHAGWIDGFADGYKAASAPPTSELASEAFKKGRNSVVFNPHSEYRGLLRQMICEGDFDFTKIFEEVTFEGETYADISNEGADALADYFIDLMEMIDERRSNDAEREEK